jgi:molybdate transport system substrate-binding protein
MASRRHRSRLARALGAVGPLLALGGAACGPPPTSAPARAPAVRVLAAASLTELVHAVAADWAAHGGGTVQAQFDASSTLARQLPAGAPGDVFLTAASEWLDPLPLRRRFDWLQNRLVCVVPASVAAFDLRAATSLALAGEQVPAGAYARAALAHEGIPLPARLILGSNVRDVLSKVAEGGAEAAIVYATDAAVEPRVRVASVFPEQSHPPIVYAVGVCTPAGEAFAAALRAPWAAARARRAGFGVID